MSLISDFDLPLDTVSEEAKHIDFGREYLALLSGIEN